jgi:hypothetical protein
LEDTKEVIRSCELKKTNNTMAKRKDRQYNSQKKGQTIQWPTERTDNTMKKGHLSSGDNLVV